MMHTLVTTLKATSLSAWVINTPSVWPICETLHFIGLSMLVGIVGLLDLRLLGFFRRIPIAALRGLLPWGLVGFVVNLVTGVLFFVGAPDQYVNNSAWWYKVAFLGVAGVNAGIFETTQASALFRLGPHDDTPTTFKVMGAVSLGSWFMVLYWGRMLPFIGNAF